MRATFDAAIDAAVSASQRSRHRPSGTDVADSGGGAAPVRLMI
jgi:hypothetical protein